MTVHDQHKTEGLTVEFVRSVLDYDPETGVFRWKARADLPTGWNAKFAGRVAGRVWSHGYVKIKIHFKNYYAHRLAWLYMTGEWPDQIDHQDCDRANNRWANLRAATNSQNQQNRSVRKDNRSGIKGVYESPDGWRAEVAVSGQRFRFGPFASAAEARDAYENAATELHGEFARVA